MFDMDMYAAAIVITMGWAYVSLTLRSAIDMHRRRWLLLKVAKEEIRDADRQAQEDSDRAGAAAGADVQPDGTFPTSPYFSGVTARAGPSYYNAWDDVPREPDPPLVTVDHPGIVRGWRAYQVDVDARLVGGNGVMWEGPSLVAACGPPSGCTCGDCRSLDEAEAACAAHLADAECSCGIYAYGHPVFMAIQRLEQRAVTAVIADCLLWGVVIEADSGYRATHARIERLFVDRRMTPEVRAALAARYGVPVVDLQDAAPSLLDEDIWDAEREAQGATAEARPRSLPTPAEQNATLTLTPMSMQIGPDGNIIEVAYDAPLIFVQDPNNPTKARIAPMPALIDGRKAVDIDCDAQGNGTALLDDGTTLATTDFGLTWQSGPTYYVDEL